MSLGDPIKATKTKVVVIKNSLVILPNLQHSRLKLNLYLL